jgi:hypothetical protein
LIKKTNWTKPCRPQRDLQQEHKERNRSTRVQLLLQPLQRRGLMGQVSSLMQRALSSPATLILLTISLDDAQYVFIPTDPITPMHRNTHRRSLPFPAASVSCLRQTTISGPINQIPSVVKTRSTPFAKSWKSHANVRSTLFFWREIFSTRIDQRELVCIRQWPC